MNEPTRLIPYNHNWTDEYPSLDREAFRWWHWVWALTLALPLVLGMLLLALLAVLVVAWGNCRAWFTRRRIARLTLWAVTTAGVAVYMWSGILVREFEAESRWIIGNGGMDRMGSSLAIWPDPTTWLGLLVGAGWTALIFWGLVWQDHSLWSESPAPPETPAAPGSLWQELWRFLVQMVCVFGALVLAWFVLGEIFERIY